uniref:Uncharacterized protein n=1 Tax=Nelumbo nucifera TaxID=4432 RepID=A0A822Z1E3_NELNU|nr:TPA_asm: hypothetical protein HUJ06_008974 [Nelumbo nucifera]
MLKVMVREGLLIKKTRELGREVGLMKKQEEAGNGSIVAQPSSYFSRS